MCIRDRSTNVGRILDQNSFQTALEQGNLNRIRAAVFAGRAGARKLDDPEVAQRLTKAVEDGISGFRTWREKVESGQYFLSEADDTPITRINERLAKLYFLNGSEELGISGLTQAIRDTFGVEDFFKLENGSENYTDALINAMEFLPRQKQMDVIEFFNQTVGEFAPSLKVSNIQDLGNYLASTVSESAKDLATQSAGKRIMYGTGADASRSLKGAAGNQPIGKTVLGDLVQGTADELPTKEVAKEVKQGIVARLQNNYVRTLVTHSGTTMLNLSGWAQMSALNVMSGTLRGTVYGSLGLIEGLVKGNMKASTYANKAATEFGSIRRQLSNLVNPYATYDQAMSYLLARPQARKELFKYIAGGVESGMDEDAILRQAGIEGANPTDKNFFEKYMQAAQVLYGVRAVDFLSKTQEFMTSLDRNIRRRYGQSYEEFLQRDDFYDLMTSKNSETFKEFMKLEAKTVQETLGNTFNRSLAGDDMIGQVAGMIEKIRTVPVIGALAPFGQFFNNTMALTADLLGASIPYHYYMRGRAKRLGKDFVEKDLMDMATKAAIGYGLLGWSVQHELQLLEEGLPLFAERQENGAVVDYRYEFPLAAFKGYGRAIAHFWRDGSIPVDVIKDVTETVGPGSFSRQLNETYGSVVDGVLDALQDPQNEMLPGLMNMLEVSMAQYASGVTRSLDPLNQVIALTRGEDYEAIDRSVGNRNINNSIRYIDQFLVPFMDPERRPPVSATTGREPAAQTNRIFGYRELPAPSTIERMFADIGRPNWKTEIYVPDGNAGRILREHIYPHLEIRAAELLESSLWETSNLRQREDAVRSIITGARRDMMESLRRSYDEPDRKAAFIYDIFNTSTRAADRDRLIESYGVTPETLWTLTEDQLDDLLYMIKAEGAASRRTSRDLRDRGPR